VEQSPVSNAACLIGELLLPGTTQYVHGNIGSGLVHSVLAGAVGALMVGSSMPVVGTLAVLGIKLNSYSSATTGRSLLNITADALNNAGDRLQAERSTPSTTATGSTTAARGASSTTATGSTE